MIGICCAAIMAMEARADDFELSKIVAESLNGGGVALNVSTQGAAPAPADQARYKDGANWRVVWRAKTSDLPTRVSVAPSIPGGQNIVLAVGGILPPGDPRTVVWTALFIPPDGMAAVPAVLMSTQRSTEANGGGAPAKQPFISPVQNGNQPDILLSGTFLAGGNTKPIYTVQEQASMYDPTRRFLGFAPGFSSALAINQNEQPPNNRTRLDPDSIQGAFSFLRTDQIGSGLLYGVTTKVDLVNGEFARSGPTSNLTTGFLSTFALRRKQLTQSSFFVLHPALGLEAGHNLNAPNSLEGTPVDLSHYGGIFRGVAGADATLGVVGKGKGKANIFSVTGTYRVRLPAMDEPFVETRHGQTLVDLTTKARHWVEVDVVYSPPDWKYFGLTAKYQYGSLPPIFSFVDQQATIGLLFQAQTLKPQ
jgi:hypothetical protein